jgi:dihydroxyacid dehydratase/phosphogluconate dehydratase
VGLITDGRFSGGTWGMVVGHVAPEAAVGGTIALVHEGDSITIDAHALQLQLNVPEDVLAGRRFVPVFQVFQLSAHEIIRNGRMCSRTKRTVQHASQKGSGT